MFIFSQPYIHLEVKWEGMCWRRAGNVSPGLHIQRCVCSVLCAMWKRWKLDNKCHPGHSLQGNRIEAMNKHPVQFTKKKNATSILGYWAIGMGLGGQVEAHFIIPYNRKFTVWITAKCRSISSFECLLDGWCIHTMTGWLLLLSLLLSYTSNTPCRGACKNGARCPLSENDSHQD